MIDYKKIIKNEKTRYAILNMCRFIPDKTMLKIQYRIKTGRRLDLIDPKRYSEKLQWMKVNYRDIKMSECADKASVRNYIKECGLEHILNECYGIYDSVEDIEWDKLPQSFVLKDTLGGGGRSMIFVSDKNELDIQKANQIMQEWIDSEKSKSFGREWIYEGRKHRIIAEKLLIADESGDLPDYKFFCFNGKVFCSYFMRNYTMHHEQGELGFFDRDFNLLMVRRTDFNPISGQPAKPVNYEKMVELAERISEGFPHVRVDFYNIAGKIVFGEMTFFNASGYVEFEPDEFDYQLGEKFILPHPVK